MGATSVLRPDDYAVAAYREHGHCLAKGADPRRAMAELFGRRDGLSKGKGGSMHLFDRSVNFLGGHAIVGSHLPLAAGVGFAIAYRGGDQVMVCYFGDGAVPEGEFHEALNLASLWKLPVIFICENNRYAMGTSRGAGAGRDGDLEVRADLRHGLRARRRHGRRWPCARWSAARWRARGRSASRRSSRRAPIASAATPCAIPPAPCTAPRKKWSRRSCAIPIALFRDARLERAGSTRPTCGPSRRTSTIASTKRWPSPRPRRSRPPNGSSPTSTRTDGMPVVTYRDALNMALREEMRRDPRVFVIGEEVGLYEGAYKVTQGLLKEFGPRRVVDTPIAESGFTGVGIGAAMVGLRPVVEMMTFNFALLALDQIVNSAAKIHYMSGGQFNVPIVIRGPGGPAHQLAAQHSQSMESYFYHVPGPQGGAPLHAHGRQGPAQVRHPRRQSGDLHRVGDALRRQGRGARGSRLPDSARARPSSGARVRDATVVAYMGMLYRALEAAEELSRGGHRGRDRRPAHAAPDGRADHHRAPCGRPTGPWWSRPGAGFAGMGSEIASFITEQAFDDLDAPVERVTGGQRAHALRAQPRAGSRRRRKEGSSRRCVACATRTATGAS